MIELKHRAKQIVAIAVVLIFAACTRSDEDRVTALESEAGLLRFIPADTPYLIATPGDFPDDVMDKMEPQLDAFLVGYHRIIRSMMEDAFAKARDEGGDVEALEKMLPVIDELESLMSVQGFREAGIDRESDVAFYGAGLLPVLRVSLSDGDLFEAALSRLEERAGNKMSVSTLDDQSYRYVGNNEARFVVAIVNDDLVLTVVPTALSKEQFRVVMGLSLPESNIAASGKLSRIAERHGFRDYMIGFIDIETLTAIFVDEQTGINAELMRMIEGDAPPLTDVCKAEIKAMAGIVPQIVTGYTEISMEKIVSKGVVELREDIAAGVATLSGSVPGMQDPHGGLFSIGMSMDLLAARTFYSDRLDAMDAAPYECEHLADMQTGIAAGREILNQPVPPIVYGFKGFLAVIEGFEGMDLANDRPPTSVDMRLLVSTDNAEGLLAMGAMFSPEIAALNLEPNGEPLRLDIPQIAATGQVVHVAMSDTAIALSVGDGMEEGLSDMLSAASPEPAPLMVMDMDAERYYSLIAAAIAEDDGDLAAMPELQESIQSMMEAIQASLSRISLEISTTDRGIEMQSTVLLAE